MKIGQLHSDLLFTAQTHRDFQPVTEVEVAYCWCTFQLCWSWSIDILNMLYIKGTKEKTFKAMWVKTMFLVWTDHCYAGLTSSSSMQWFHFPYKINHWTPMWYLTYKLQRSNFGIFWGMSQLPESTIVTKSSVLSQAWEVWGLQRQTLFHFYMF